MQAGVNILGIRGQRGEQSSQAVHDFGRVELIVHVAKIIVAKSGAIADDARCSQLLNRALHSRQILMDFARQFRGGSKRRTPPRIGGAPVEVLKNIYFDAAIGYVPHKILQDFLQDQVF